MLEGFWRPVGPVRVATVSAELGCRANTRSDRMHPPFGETPADVADIRGLGYRYDTTDGSPANTTRPRPTTEIAAGSPFACLSGT